MLASQTSILALQTSGMNRDIDTSLTQYWYIRLLYVSSVMANFSSGDTGILNLVVHFVILDCMAKQIKQNKEICY